MKKIITTGILSILASQALLAEVKVDSKTNNVSENSTAITLTVTDSATKKALTSNVKFRQLKVSNGSNIEGMDILSSGKYLFNVTHQNCSKELKEVFDLTVNGKKVGVPYTICKEDKSRFETAHPYKDNTKQEKIIETRKDGVNGEYYLEITGETESNFDTVTFTDLSGNILTASVYNADTGSLTAKNQKLKFSGKLNHILKLSQDKVKVIFTSDGSVVKHGVTIDFWGHLTTDE